MSFKLPIQTLNETHEKLGFQCEMEPLADYLRKRAGQDAKKKIAVIYVQTDDDAKTIVGFYTLSATTIDAGDLPSALSKILPKYPRIPATLIGRLAVDKRHAGKRLGERLLVDALKRAYRSSMTIASMAVVVDAKNDKAVTFYQRYGFASFPDQPHRLFLPMNTIQPLASEQT